MVVDHPLYSASLINTPSLPHNRVPSGMQIAETTLIYIQDISSVRSVLFDVWDDCRGLFDFDSCLHWIIANHLKEREGLKDLHWNHEDRRFKLVQTMTENWYATRFPNLSLKTVLTYYIKSPATAGLCTRRELCGDILLDFLGARMTMQCFRWKFRPLS